MYAVTMAADLDLHAMTLDVRRLTRSHPSFRAAIERGYDADDLLQEVWLVVLSRQQGPTPYDSSRGSFSKWLYQVIRSVVSHVAERTTTRARHEQVGVQGAEEVEDASAWASEHVDVDIGDDERAALVAALGDDKHNEIARYLLTGRSVKEARRYFRRRGPSWEAEVDRVAGRVQQRLTAAVRRARSDDDGT